MNYVEKFEDEGYLIFRSELEDINKWRQYREKADSQASSKLKTQSAKPNDLITQSPNKPTTDHNLVGLTFSGGGIRSATFNLGLLQALSRNKTLHKVDYLSTVSGGGYIGACVNTLINSDLKGENPWAAENFPFARKVADKQQDCDKKTDQNPSFERDAAGIDKAPVRHLRYFSNYITAEGGIIGKYFLPAMVFLRGIALNFLLLVPYLIALGLMLALLFDIPGLKNNSLFLDLPEFQKALEERNNARIPLRDYALKVTSGLPQNFTSEEERIKVARVLDDSKEETQELQIKLNQAISNLNNEWKTIWIIPGASFGLLLLIASLSRFLYHQPFEKRRRCSRFLSWIFFISVLSLALELYGIAIAYWEVAQLSASINLVALLALLAPKLVGMLDSTNQQKKKPWVKIVLSITLLSLVPIFFLYLIGIVIHYTHLYFFSPPRYLLLIAATIFFFYLTRRFININEISLHSFYRDRLSRAYLMQNAADSRYPFQRIEHRDQLKLSGLAPGKGPYHIFNTTLNLSKRMPKDGTRKQEGTFRTGESFILTRKWCGSEKTGYEQTKSYEKKDPHMDIGTAMAISGAAANIGMAQKNIPILRLLMGLLNVRLGYWAPHPQRTLSWIREVILGNFPGSWSVMGEYFGKYFLTDSHVNISDGGHLDNIGVYELLRRRCKYIIVGDAEADPTVKFEALSYIIRLARIDFGIDIEIDISDIKPDEETGFSRNHCAVGRIIYPEGGIGYLFYLKSSLTGDEPQHLHEYKVKHPDFPHQTTADQWFDEQQFEAYRELGHHIGKKAFEPLARICPERSEGPLFSTDDLEKLFIELWQFWYPHSEAVERHFTKHTQELNRIIMEIKNDPALSFMDAQIYPEWEALIRGSGPSPTVNLWLPSKAEEIRRGFYICNLLIQLMENVYTDLDLETEYSHPDNRGWMNLFRHWSWSGMFRLTWTISASTFGARFQGFCEKHLQLDLGELEVEQVVGLANIDKAIKTGLNPYEGQIIEKFKAHGIHQFARLFLLKLRVSDPLTAGQAKEFNFGFALVNPADEIIYFRVQDHLRKMGLGRRTLREMIKSHNLKEGLEEELETKDVEKSGLASLKKMLSR